MEIVRGLEITVLGMAGVFATLVLLQGVILLTGLFVKIFNRSRSSDKKPYQTQPSESLLNSPDIPAEHLAAIAAAVAMLGQSYRIRTIKTACPENWERGRYTDINSL